MKRKVKLCDRYSEHHYPVRFSQVNPLNNEARSTGCRCDHFGAVKMTETSPTQISSKNAHTTMFVIAVALLGPNTVTSKKQASSWRLIGESIRPTLEMEKTIEDNCSPLPAASPGVLENDKVLQWSSLTSITYTVSNMSLTTVLGRVILILTKLSTIRKRFDLLGTSASSLPYGFKRVLIDGLELVLLWVGISTPNRQQLHKYPLITRSKIWKSRLWQAD